MPCMRVEISGIFTPTITFYFSVFWFVCLMLLLLLLLHATCLWTFLWTAGTKLSQAKKFNDPDDPCKILVATDAIGMGLNL